MANGHEILQQLDKMDHKLDENFRLSQENSKAIHLINQALRGNGGKGLFQRMDEREEWEKEHDMKLEQEKKELREEQRLNKRDVIARRALEATVIGAILGAVFAILELVL